MEKHEQDKPNSKRLATLYYRRNGYKTDGVNSVKYKVKTRIHHNLYTKIFVYYDHNQNEV